MERRKICAESRLLQRPFHFDAFVTGSTPRFSMLFFGGSGISNSVYWERRETIVPVFDQAFATLERTLSFGFVFVTAPFDVPFLRFPDDPVAADRWSAHVRSELLPKVGASLPVLHGLPRYTIGYSGGAALALSGHQTDRDCFGVGLLGADGLTTTIATGDGWPEPVTLYYNQEDDVFEPNRETLGTLASAGTVQVFRQLAGGHPLADYIANESFGGRIRRAARTIPR